MSNFYTYIHVHTINYVYLSTYLQVWTTVLCDAWHCIRNNRNDKIMQTYIHVGAYAHVLYHTIRTCTYFPNNIDVHRSYYYSWLKHIIFPILVWKMKRSTTEPGDYYPDMGTASISRYYSTYCHLLKGWNDKFPKKAQLVPQQQCNQPYVERNHCFIILSTDKVRTYKVCITLWFKRMRWWLCIK